MRASARSPRYTMSYRTERRAQVSKRIASRTRDMEALASSKDASGRPRHPNDIARVRKHIETDLAYLQAELEGLVNSRHG